MGFVVVLCILGSYGARGNMVDVIVTMVAGVMAYVLRRQGFPMPPSSSGWCLASNLK